MTFMILHVLKSSSTSTYQWSNEVPGGCVKKGKEVDKGNKSPAGDVGLQAPSTVKATRELEKLPLSSESQSPTLAGTPRNKDPKPR